MTTRLRRILIAAASLALALFAGRWIAVTLADRWWGLSLSPAAGRFLTDLNLLALTLDLAGVLIATAWFTGNLLAVYRAIGTVEVSRQIANLEVREALGPRALLGGTVGLGLVLGIVTGGDVSRHWRVIALAWQGVTFGMTEPILGHDAGLYVAELPLWSLLQGYAQTLAMVGLVVVVVLYAVIGAVRWNEGRPAISDHARRHLGWLLSALALTLAWGLLLQPYEFVSGAAGEIGTRQFHVSSLTSPALAGAALMVALVSLVWAFQARHFLLLAGWAVLAAGWMLSKIVIASLLGTGDVPLGDSASRRALDATAFGLESIRDSFASPWTGPGVPPAAVSLWQTEPLVRIGDADSLLTSAADPSWITTPGGRRAAWLLVVTAHDGHTSLRAVADDRSSGTGGPLYYRVGDSMPAPAPVAMLELSDAALHPGAPPVALGPNVRRVAIGSSPRRLALAWALQEQQLLGAQPAGAEVDWARAPRVRLQKLAPYAEWSAPVPRVDGDRLLWVADGYVESNRFPLSTRVQVGADQVGMLRAAFIGTVDAETGETHIHVRPDAGPVADAWASLAGGVVEPWLSLSAYRRSLLPYPGELFLAQARVIESASTGTLVGRADSTRMVPVVSSFYWPTTAGHDGPARTADYVRGAPGQLQSLLVGSSSDGRLALTRIEVDSAVGIAGPGVLEQRWEHFPTFVQVLDSVRAGGGVLVAGGTRYWVSAGAIGATQVRYGPRGGGGASVTWVSVASGSRIGAARNFPQAWINLQGATAPLAPGGANEGVLTDARRWFQIADSAFRRGDFTAFGRAFEELRTVLEIPQNAPH